METFPENRPLRLVRRSPDVEFNTPEDRQPMICVAMAVTPGKIMACSSVGFWVPG